MRKIEVEGNESGTQWCMAFVYMPADEVLVVGRSAEVRKYIREHFDIYMCQLVNYRAVELMPFKIKIKSIDKSCHMKIFNKRILIVQPHGHLKAYPNKQMKASRHFIFKYKKEELLRLRRLPKKWIPEYDEIVRKVIKDESISKEELICKIH